MSKQEQGGRVPDLGDSSSNAKFHQTLRKAFVVSEECHQEPAPAPGN